MLGTRLPLVALFQQPTIEHLAETLRAHQSAPSWPIVVPLPTGGSRPPLFVIHPLDGDVVVYATLLRYLDFDDRLRLRARGIDGIREPDEHERIVAEYVA